MLKEVRYLVEGLSIDYPKKIQESLIQEPLKVLLEAPPREGEDCIIVVIKEAIDRGHLSPCDETAAIISGIISKASPHRDILTAIADGINDPVVCQDPTWLDDIIFEDTDIAPDARKAFWDCIDRVQEVRRLFAQAPYSSAVDERCTPTPAEPYYTSGHVDSYGYAHLDSAPTIDDLCDDEPESEPPKHYRPDPVPSDWKKDDTCPSEASTNTSASTSQAESTTDKWPEDDTTGDYFVDGDYVDYF